MAKHTETSWKPDNPINQLSNSVDKVTHAVKQAVTHPSQQLIKQTENAIDRAERGIPDAVQSSENQEPIQRLVEQLNQDKEQLQRVQAIENEVD